jgi:FtsH-binding integral membrane protein
MNTNPAAGGFTDPALEEPGMDTGPWEAVERRLSRLVRQAIGLTLVASGGLCAVATFLTWDTYAGGVTVETGADDGDGQFTFLLGLVLVATGGVVALWRTSRWALSLAAIDSLTVALVFRLDQVSFDNYAGTHVGAGLRVLGISSIIGVCAATVGLVTLSPGRSGPSVTMSGDPCCAEVTG